MTDRETYNIERQRCKCAYRIPLQHNLCFVKLLYMRPRGQRDKTLNQPDDSHYQSGRFHKKRESKSNDPWDPLDSLGKKHRFHPLNYLRTSIRSNLGESISEGWSLNSLTRPLHARSTTVLLSRADCRRLFQLQCQTSVFYASPAVSY